MNNNIPYIDLLCNSFKMNNKTRDQTLSISPPTDDNKEIMKLLEERLKLGKERYGHGVIVDEDTSKYGTNENDWELMALEEMLDGLIYTTASIIRYRRQKKQETKSYNDSKVQDDMIVKYRYLKYNKKD